jgi:hypothetical protein
LWEKKFLKNNWELIFFKKIKANSGGSNRRK